MHPTIGAGRSLPSAPHLLAHCLRQDVDQRLTRDVERLCDDLSALIPSLVKPLVDLAWFSFALARLTGRRGMGVLYLYAIAGFAVLHTVTPNFGALLHKVRPSALRESLMSHSHCGPHGRAPDDLAAFGTACLVQEGRQSP